MKDWSAKQYLKFEDERTRPSRDLVNAIPLDKAVKIVDIGCGPGNSTEVLAKRWPDAQLSGFDSSPAMIEKAKLQLPAAHFEVANIYEWLPDSDTDIVFSNAVFQWLPDHLKEMQRLFAVLKKGAVFAFQMPDNLGEPSHVAMQEVAQDPRWRARIGNVAREKLPDISVYYDAFAKNSHSIDIWHTVYNHVMTGHEAIVEWFKSTALRPFLAPLSEDEQADYISLYFEKLINIYPLQCNGKVLLHFPRLFMVVVK